MDELTWNNANKWEIAANTGKSDTEPKWHWDCNFKLDFDGALLSVSSRFYPPGKHYGDKWSGGLDIMFMNECLITKEFECDTLDELKNQIEGFLNDYTAKVKQLIKHG